MGADRPADGDPDQGGHEPNTDLGDGFEDIWYTPDAPASAAGDLDADPYGVGTSEPAQVPRAATPAATTPPVAPPTAPGPEPVDLSPPGPEAEAEAPPPLLANPVMPWVLVGIVVIVALAVILSGRDSGSGRQAGTFTGNTAAPQGEGAGGSAPTVAPTAAPKACPDFSLGANLLGVPGIAAEPGIHIWHDMEGFHLRVVPGEGSVDAIAGTIASTGDPLTLIGPGAPAASIGEDGVITFDLSGDTSELNFKAACKTESVRFDISSGGAPVSPDQVTVGQGNRPASVPVELVRGQP